MKKNHTIILLVIAVIVAYVYLNKNVRREGLEPTFGIPPENVQIPIPGATTSSSGTVYPTPVSTSAPTPGPMPSYVTNNPFTPTTTTSGSSYPSPVSTAAPTPGPMPSYVTNNPFTPTTATSGSAYPMPTPYGSPQPSGVCGKCVRGLKKDGTCA